MELILSAKYKQIVLAAVLAPFFLTPFSGIARNESTPAEVIVIGDSDNDAAGVQWSPGITLRIAISLCQLKEHSSYGMLLTKDRKRKFNFKHLHRDDVGKTVLSSGDLIVFGPLDETREKALRNDFCLTP